jgi:hypothetical protein
MSDGGTPEHDTRPFWIDQWIAGIIAAAGLALLFSHDAYLGLPSWYYGAALSTVGFGWLLLLRYQSRAVMTAQPAARSTNVLGIMVALVATVLIGIDVYRHWTGVTLGSVEPSPSHLGCKPITTTCPKGFAVKILEAGPQTSVLVFNTGNHQILVGGSNISTGSGEGAPIPGHTSITIDSSAAVYCYGVDDSSTVSIECTSP